MKPKDLVIGQFYWFESSYAKCYCRYIGEAPDEEYIFYFYDENESATLFKNEISLLSIPNTYDLNKFLAKEL